MAILRRDDRRVAVILEEKVAASVRKPLRVTKPTVPLFQRPLPVAPKDPEADIEDAANALVGGQ